MNDTNAVIVRHIGVLSEGTSGWRLELNVVRWFGGEPKLDIHKWSPDHERCNTCSTLTKEEAKNLVKLLKKEV